MVHEPLKNEGGREPLLYLATEGIAKHPREPNKRKEHTHIRVHSLPNFSL